MKKIIILSTVALTLILQGCGSNSKSSSGDTPKTTVSEELKNFAKGLTESNEMTSVVKKTGSSQSSNSQTTTKTKMYYKENIQSCKDGGTIKITSDLDFDNIEEASFEQAISDGLKAEIAFDKCIEDGLISDGYVSLNIKGKELSKISLTFTKDTTFEDLESQELTKVFKGSTMTIEEISDDSERITESVRASSSTGENYESINLVSIETTTEEDRDSSYEISGKMVRDGITYSVDEKYDSSKTPMVFNSDGDLISGTAKYYNEQNHHITMNIVYKNEVKISVDTDNDGKIDEEETISI